jgi:acyl-CoA synthetase (AMP-forming)/AMP-acid ligase II
VADRVRACAAGLAAHGLGDGDRVMLVSENCRSG